MTLEGGCYCGALRYVAEGEPTLKAQCHCRECQYISGGAPNMFLLMPPDGFQYTKGTPKRFITQADSGLAIRGDGGTIERGRPLRQIRESGVLDGAFPPPVAVAVSPFDIHAMHQIRRAEVLRRLSEDRE